MRFLTFYRDQQVKKINLLGKTVYYQKTDKDEIRNRLLCFRWKSKKIINHDKETNQKIIKRRETEKKIDVSIIVPVYNAENYLNQCIKSLLNQTDKNLEFIFINDNSNDKSLEILRNIKDKRVVVINLKSNLGVAAARNIGISFSKGKYIGFVDPDDYIDLNYFGHLYKLGRLNNADIVMSTNITRISDNGFKIGKKYSGYDKNTGVPNFRDRMRIALTTGITWNKIYNSDFIKKNLILFPEIKTMGTDNYFTFLSQILGNKIITTNKVSYYYRENPNSIIRKKKNETYFKQVDVYRRTLERIQSLDISNSYKKEWLKTLNYRAINDFYSNLAGFDDEFKNEFIDYIDNTYELITLRREVLPIISLTSYPARISTIHLTIESLKQQNVNFKKIILYLSVEQFPNKEKNLPDSLIKLIDDKFKICWLADDIRSYKKLIPALEQFPSDVIITADDDVIYPKDWVERLIRSYLVEPDCIHCLRGRNIKVSENIIEPYNKWRLIKYPLFPSFKVLPTGVGGCLYTKKLLDDDIFNKEVFTEYAANADDIWFWAMALKKGTKIKIATPTLLKPKIIAGTQETALWNINVSANDKIIENMFTLYPEIKEKLIS